MVPCGRASSLTTVRRANVTKYTPRNHDMNWLNGKCLLRLVGFDTETTSGVICSMRRVGMNESASICGPILLTCSELTSLTLVIPIRKKT